jgi:hypothetical protein
LILRAIQFHQGRRKPWNAGQLIAKTLQHCDALDERWKHGQSQITEIEFSVLTSQTAQKTIDSNVHGWWLGCHLGACLPFYLDIFDFNFFEETHKAGPLDPSLSF